MAIVALIAPTSSRTPATAARVGLTRQRTLHLHHLPTQVVEGLVQHAVNRILRVKSDEAKTPGALCVLVVHHHDISNNTIGLEVLPEPFLSQSRGQPAHKDLLRPSTTGISAAAAARVPPAGRVRGLGGLLLLPRERPLHIDRAAVEGVGVLQRAVDDGGVGEDDEAEAPGAAGELVAHDGGLGDLAVGGEVLAQLLLRRLPRDAADEELALVRLHLSASAPLRALACCGGGRAELGISGVRIWGLGAEIGRAHV